MFWKVGGCFNFHFDHADNGAWGHEAEHGGCGLAEQLEEARGRRHQGDHHPHPLPLHHHHRGHPQ